MNKGSRELDGAPAGRELLEGVASPSSLFLSHWAYTVHGIKQTLS